LTNSWPIFNLMQETWINLISRDRVNKRKKPDRPEATTMVHHEARRWGYAFELALQKRSPCM
jgi:hypothetical protein